MNPKGEGHFYKRGDYFCWRLRHNGKQVVRSAKSPKLLAAKVRVVRREIAEMGAIRSGKASLGKWLESWIDSHAKLVKPKTAALYRSVIRLHLCTNAVSKKKLSEVVPSDIDSLLSSIGRNRTSQLCRQVLRKAFVDAERDGLVYRNPAALSRTIRVEKRSPRFLTAPEVLALRNALTGSRFEPLIVYLLETGLRISEALGMSRLAPVGTVVKSKTFAGSRTVPQTQEALAALERMAEIRKTDAQRCPFYQDSGLHFQTELGSPMGPRNVQRALDAALSKANLPHISLHDLRRTFATHAATITDQAALKSIMGHEQFATTQEFYVKPLEDKKAEAMMKFDYLEFAKGTNKGTKGQKRKQVEG